MKTSKKLRIGAVNYLNTRPLIYGLDRLAPAAEIRMDLPSRLADGLAQGRYDVALIPSLEFLQRRDYVIVSDACIGCRGPVLSVKLFSRVPMDRIRTLALDEGSRTSIALARILLHHRFGLVPECEPLPIDQPLAAVTTDAMLVIGDRAIQAPGGGFCDVWDLGDEWVRWTGLPFVFAMWTARGGAELGGLEQALGQARDQGLAALEEIAAAEAARHGLSRPQCLAYLRDNLHFFLGERQRQGLARFASLAAGLGLAPAGVELGCESYDAVG